MIADKLSQAFSESDLLVERLRGVDGLRRQAPASPLGAASAFTSGSPDFLGVTKGMADASEQYKHNKGWVYASSRILADSIEKQPVHVVRLAPRRHGRRMLSDCVPPERIPQWLTKQGGPGDFEVLSDHPFLRAIRRPNQYMVQASLLRVTVQSFAVTGRAIWWFFGENGKKSIWYLPASWASPKHDRDGSNLFSSWEVRPGGGAKSFTVPGEDIAYLYNADPADPFESISPLQMIATAVSADESIQDAQWRGFRNALNPGMIITAGEQADAQGNKVRPKLSVEQRKQIIGALRQMYRGVMHHLDPIILDRIITDVKPYTRKNTEMDFMKSGQQTKARIMQGGFGVNPITIGEVEGANRASSVVAQETLCDHAINPIIELMSQVLTRFALPHFDKDPNVAIIIEPCTPNNPETRLKIESQLSKAKAVSRNELRARHGLPPVDGLDTVIMSPNEISVPLGGEPDGSGSEHDNERQNKVSSDAWRALRRANGASDARVLSERIFIKQFDKSSKEIESAMFSFLKAQRASIVNELRELSKDSESSAKVLNPLMESAVAADPKEWVKGNQIAAEAITDQVFRAVDWDEPLKEVAGGQLRDTMLSGAIAELEVFSSQVGITRQVEEDILFQLPPGVRRVVESELAETLAQDYWSGVNRTTRDRLRGAIGSGLDDGLNMDQLAGRVQQSMGDDTLLSRARGIARTETTGALGAGHNAVIQDLGSEGLVESKEWLPILDQDTRDAHADMAGVIVGYNELFDVGGEQAPYPGWFGLSAEQRVNCRCVPISILSEQALNPAALADVVGFLPWSKYFRLRIAA